MMYESPSHLSLDCIGIRTMARFTPLRALALYASFLWTFSKANASMDPRGGPWSDSFTYSQSLTVDLSHDELEESMLEPEPQILASSLLYSDDEDDECLVLSQAIMCHGDDLLPSDLSEQKIFETSDYIAEESDEEDDDDDDNDGHSSMLSNASLKRPRAFVGGSASATSSSQSQDLKSLASSPTAFTSSASGAASQALALRGGAANDLGAEVVKRLAVAALVTLVFEGMIGHILEFLKIVMQTSEAALSYAEVIKRITAEKGITGLWDGFCPWGIVQAVFKGAVFGLAHATAMGLLVPMAEEGKIPMQAALTLAGGIGGGFQGYVLSPTLLLKTRVMTNPVFRENMSILKTTWLSFLIGFEVVKTEGITTLMKGANVFATKRVFDWASRYFFADLFEDLFLALNGGLALSLAQKSMASILGGVASTCVTLPLDVLVAKTQDAKKAGVKVSAVKLFRDELKEKGWGGLRNAYMRGFEARLLHVCLTTVVIKTGTPVVYDAMFGKQ
jgi:hypothetical protein